MNLEEFISDTLMQIIKGVKKADDQAKAAKDGGRVNPPVMDPGNKTRTAVFGNVYQTTDMIEFDIALTVSNEAMGGGKVGIVHIASIGSEVSSTNTSFSRVKFKVPVALPQEFPGA
jgi:hypothetical protein